MKLPVVLKGDIFEIETKIGLAYLQCVEESSQTECELIRILPGVYSSIESADLEKLVEKKGLFFIELPLKYAQKKKCVKKIGNYLIPQTVIVPEFYRSKHIIRDEFLGWHIVNRKTLKRELVKELSDEQMNLSPYGAWNDTLIKERIEEGWTLDKWL